MCARNSSRMESKDFLAQNMLPVLTFYPDRNRIMTVIFNEDNTFNEKES